MEYPNFQYPALQVIAEWFCPPNRHTKFQESKSWEESKRGAVRGQGEKRENPYLLSLPPPLPPSFALTPTLTAAISTRPNKSFSVTWSAALQIAWNKRKFLHVKRVQFPQDFFVHKHGRRFIILYTNMAAVTSCENDPFPSVTKDGGYGNTKWNKQLSPALNTPIDISVGYIYKQVLFISELQHYGMYTDDHANYTAVSVTMIANTFMTDWPIQKILTSGKK